VSQNLQPATGSKEPGALAAEAGEKLKAEVTSPVVVSATRRILAGFVAMVVCLLVLAVLAATIRRQQLNGIDAAITPFLHGLASPALDTLMQGATFVGSDPVLFAVAALTVAWLMALKRPRREPLFLVVALGGSIALNQAMKLIFERARPQLDWAHIQTDYSFPSGHSMNSLVLYLSLALLIWLVRGRRAGLVSVAGAVVLALTIGVSRIYLGYHYFTDVVGGFTAGLLWLLIVAGIFEIGPRLRQRWWPGRGRVEGSTIRPPGA
jgi:undecaprenyl-diphosphatase